MSDIRFNQWLHQSGTGGVSQVDGGHVGIGTTNPDIAVHSANAKKLNVGIVTANSVYAGNFYGDGSNLTGTGHVDKIIEGDTKVEVVDSGSQYIVGEVNGTEALRIDSSGRVLIGTTIQGTAGADKLTLSTGGSTGITIRSGSSNDGNLYFAMGTTGNETYRGFIQYEHSNNAFRFGTNATERLRITSDGKFGFGTASPDQTVHIHKGSAGSIDSTATSVLTLENSTTAVLQFLTPNNVSAQLRFGDPQDNGAGFIDYSHTTNTMAFGANGPTRMQLDGNGHLGINVASVTQLANSKQLTLRPSDDDGIRLIRPGDANNSPNVHLDLTTTTSGSAFPTGEAYTTKYKTANIDQIFETAEGGGTGGNISFRTRSSSGETFRITSDGYLNFYNDSNTNKGLRWYNNVGGSTKAATIEWGNGNANWEFRHFRNDNQANNPYANIDFYTGGWTTSPAPTRALRITNDGNHIREKHSRFATRINYASAYEGANTKLDFRDPHVNVGGDFSSGTDRYTAPVDGDYAFWFHTNVEKSGGGSFYATFYKNGSEANGSHGGRIYDQHSGSGWNNLSGCIMLNLSEGDYVEVYNGGQSVNYDGNSYGQFMGWLVG